MTRRVEVGTPTGVAWLDLDRPRGKPSAVLLLGHGAGGGVEAIDLLAVRDAAVRAGVLVARMTQPYRVLGRRAPAPAPRLDEAWVAASVALTRMRGLRALPLIVGGRSSGARVACRNASALDAAAVIALAFPLHAPGKSDQPESSRLGELEQPTVAVLVVQGDRDAFGMPPPSPARRLVIIPGADHSLKKDPAAVAQAVLAFLELNRMTSSAAAGPV